MMQAFPIRGNTLRGSPTIWSNKLKQFVGCGVDAYKDKRIKDTFPLLMLRKKKCFSKEMFLQHQQHFFKQLPYKPMQSLVMSQKKKNKLKFSSFAQSIHKLN